MTLLHASCIAMDGIGVLIRGPSGRGKSDLALRLIDAGAELVADDYCEMSVADGQLTVSAPDPIAGKIEVRGYGVIDMPYRRSATVGLVVDLIPLSDIERFPEERPCTIDGVTIRRLTVDPDTVSAAPKVRFALRHPVEEPTGRADQT